MTLPFRRRHHDDEGSHDRARSLSSSQLIEPLDADAATWLSGHLESCSECRRETEGFAADRELLRSLRDKPIEPPRDLWARTSAALDREAGKRGPADRRADRRSPAPRQRGIGSPWQRLPVGAAAGVLILLVVLGTAFLPGILPPKTPSGTQVAHATGVPGPTAIVIAAVPIPALRSAADGSWDLFYTEVNKVCPRSSPECVPPPGNGTTQTLGQLSAKASTMTISPDDDQLVFEATGGTAGVYVVPVPSKGSVQTPSPSATPGTSSQPPVTAEPASPEPTPAETPPGQLEIASGVTVVGEVAYSPDGRYLAFSAAPINRSTGPDLYVWSAGSGTAVAVTSDHATYFSGWLGSQVLASHLAVVAGPGQSGSPESSDQPGASGGNGHGNGQGNGLQIEAHPSSFLLDPATLVRTDLAQADVWLPVVDVSARSVVYWSGTLTSKDGLTWELGTGQVVLDKWSTGPATPEPGTSGATGASQVPDASGLPVVGPVGEAKPLQSGKVADFRAKFDPAGTHLALWIGENLQEPVGRLHLIVIDPATGAVSSAEPLPGTPALRRFSIDANRLAWVTPPGQDGQESSLQVLGWDGDSFGEIHTEPAQDLLILR
jgi:WD40-like Beta Propeller Repeat